MRIIQRLLFAVTGILGASVGVITMALINWGFNLNLPFTTAFCYGLFGGLLLGWVIAIYVSIVIMKMIRRKLMAKFGGLFSIANSFLKRKHF